MSVYATDWPREAPEGQRRADAVAGELSRLCAEADNISMAAYQIVLDRAIADLQRRWAPLPERGLTFEGMNCELEEACGLALARIAAVCGGEVPEPVADFAERLRSCAFSSPAEMMAAAREAAGALR